MKRNERFEQIGEGRRDSLLAFPFYFSFACSGSGPGGTEGCVGFADRLLRDLEGGKEGRNSADKNLLCYWAIKELGMTAVAVAKRASGDTEGLTVFLVFPVFITWTPATFSVFGPRPYHIPTYFDHSSSSPLQNRPPASSILTRAAVIRILVLINWLNL